MRVYPSVSFISSHKLFGVDETLIKPNSIAVSLKIYVIQPRNTTYTHTPFSSQNETEEKRDPWPPCAYRGVFLCSQNEALLISHSEEGR